MTTQSSSDYPMLIETILIKNGRVRNIHYHNKRFNNTRRSLFDAISNIQLRRAIDPSLATSAYTKCRVSYRKDIENIEYEDYSIHPITSLKLVDIGNISYPYKFNDRSEIDALYHKKGAADGILMMQDGFLKDTSYTNISLHKNNVWYTPQSPLLLGTMRQFLIDKGKIQEVDIHYKDITTYDRITLFNAMIPFGKIIFSTDRIV